MLRFTSFIAGILGFRGTELLVAHHAPAVPLLRRWVSNLGLGLINGLIVSLACGFCFAFSPASTPSPIGLTLLPPPLCITAEIIILDFITYIFHRAYHELPLLWRLHAVHHSDLDLDVSSASRFHPGEVLLSASAKVAIVFFLKISPLGLVTFETVMLGCAQFQHSNIQISAPIERWLWRFLVPPEMHRLHHSPNIADNNSNYGTILTVWDRALGTLNGRLRNAREPFGVAELGGRSLQLPALLLLPFRRVIQPVRPSTA
jgi:sterol desaturase/sphingolipid hydroxylase (fatty acid hydroxylase superfamily)